MPVNVHYRSLENSAQAIEPGQYDPTQPLVIESGITFFPDPRFNGSRLMDSDGNFIGANEAIAPAFGDGGDVLCDAVSGVGGCSDVWVAQWSPSGEVRWITIFGGSAAEHLLLIRAGAQGEVYIAGITFSSDFPVGHNAAQPAYGGAHVISGAFGLAGDVFIARLRGSDGQLDAATYFGGEAQDYPTGLAVDAKGIVYLTGTTDGTVPTTPGVYRSSTQGGTGFAVKWDSNANKFRYSTMVEPLPLASGSNADGELYYVASGGAGPTTAGAIQKTQIGPSDVYFAALREDSTGRLLISRLDIRGQRLTLNKWAAARAGDATIHVDSSDRATLVAVVGACNSPTTPDALQGGQCSYYDLFLLRYDATGRLLFGSFVEGTPLTGFDRQGNPYFGGYSPITILDFQAPTRARLVCTTNAASLYLGLGNPIIAPGGLFRLIGGGFGPSDPVSAAPDQSGAYPLELGGISVRINGTAAPIVYVSGGLVLFQAPFSLYPSLARVELHTADGQLFELDNRARRLHLLPSRNSATTVPASDKLRRSMRTGPSIHYPILPRAGRLSACMAREAELTIRHSQKAALRTKPRL